ncbi:hypothetical protein SLEP1_g4748 [Rubroshorea leprosula]|uniref:laccase n=1 Tax=Rubroshorea leprosula TaxID=152421 RepID=A0AAV5HYL3_9ROSI|nr:hypothetical protein SLEP1_g4748 [Rubroshorea leprosula]
MSYPTRKEFSTKVTFSVEGTLWWHAHNNWGRATVHGAIIVYPKFGTTYPFPPPHVEVPIILESLFTQGGDPNVSDALTINGQPSDLYPCSPLGTFKLRVDQGKTYLLRLVNAAMNTILFFSVAKHKLTVVGIDGSYTKALTKEFVTISPGQTMDALLEAKQKPSQYYMATRAYSTGFNVLFDNTTTTVIVHLRSLANEEHPIDIPLDIQTQMILTLSVNAFPYPHGNAPSSCQGPNVTRLAASMNNISFITPSIDIL